jgi:hypothetical protein
MPRFGVSHSRGHVLHYPPPSPTHSFLLHTVFFSHTQLFTRGDRSREGLEAAPSGESNTHHHPIRSHRSALCGPSVCDRFQCIGYSKIGVNPRFKLALLRSRPSQGLSNDVFVTVLHLWWKSPPPPQNTSAVVGKLNNVCLDWSRWCLGLFPRSSAWSSCCLLLQYLLQSCSSGGRGIVEDATCAMRYGQNLAFTRSFQCYSQP